MLGERIKELRLERNLSQEQLATILGYKSRSSIHYIEQGSVDVPNSKVAEFAKFFDVDVDYLMGNSDTRNKKQRLLEIREQFQLDQFAKEISKPIYEKLEAELGSSNVCEIPVYGKIAAGIPIEAVEDILECIEIPREWTKSGKQFIGLKVQGDSMYPKYWEGDTVIIEVTPDANSGDDCALYVNGYEVTLKTIKFTQQGITLQPYNNQHAPKTYSRDEVCILGKVKQLRRDS